MDDLRHRGRRRELVVLAVSAVLAATVFAVLVARNRHTSANGAAGPSASAVQATGPFGDTPAAKWRDASDALVMPHAAAVGTFSASDVAAALKRARTYLLTARANPAVLEQHQVSILQTQLDSDFLDALRTSTQPIQSSLDATFLAPRNRLAAPVRVLGSVTDSYGPPSGGAPARLQLNVNLVWAYALTADYAVAPIGSHVVTIHEKVEVDFWATATGRLDKPSLGAGNILYFDSDCGFFNQRMLGLPRTDDPDVVSESGRTLIRGEGFDPNADLRSSRTCRVR